MGGTWASPPTVSFARQSVKRKNKECSQALPCTKKHILDLFLEKGDPGGGVRGKARNMGDHQRTKEWYGIQITTTRDGCTRKRTYRHTE